MESKTVCPFCGELHGLVCPFVRAKEYYRSGELKRIEFNEPPAECQHRNRIDMSVSGLEHWLCKDCGLEHEKKLN